MNDVVVILSDVVAHDNEAIRVFWFPITVKELGFFGFP